MPTSSNDPPWKVKNASIPSRRRYIAPDHVLKQYQAHSIRGISDNPTKSVAGISICGWEIGTGQGPIGSSAWFDHKLEELEQQSQCQDSASRKIVLPEMVFPYAHLACKTRGDHQLVFVSWDAMGALTEWSQAHQHIPLPDTNISDTIIINNDNHNETSSNTNIQSYRGVSVLKSSDASLWKKKREKASEESIESTVSSVFHYDWTYSTPYCGNVVGVQDWTGLESSGIPMHLLTDQTVPILYFDQVVMIEDDLHDNGLVQYSAKIRVMPTCVYVLAKLFVRIDHVLLRLRECRVLIHFQKNQIYRDITWRECQWKDLHIHGLPSDLRAWTKEGDGGMETPAFSMLLSKLPDVSTEQLPPDLLQHTTVVYSNENVTIT